MTRRISMNIELREYQKHDFKELETIVRKTWNYDQFSSPNIAAKLAKVFLSSCLTNYTFSRVALLDGVPVGIILGKAVAKHTCPLKHRLKQVGAIISLYSTKEGRNVAKIFGNVNGIDQQLIKECGKAYPAELALFAINPSCRGKGIGKLLFQSVIEYFKQNKIDEFYLFTDISCNYGFYEHQNMTRRNEKEFTFQIGEQSANMNFFIYDAFVDNIVF